MGRREEDILLLLLLLHRQHREESEGILNIDRERRERRENISLFYLIELLSQPILLLLQEKKIIRKQWLRHGHGSRDKGPALLRLRKSLIDKGEFAGDRGRGETELVRCSSVISETLLEHSCSLLTVHVQVLRAGLRLQHARGRRTSLFHVEIFAFRTVGTLLSIGTQRGIGFVVIAIVPIDNGDQQGLKAKCNREGRVILRARRDVLLLLKPIANDSFFQNLFVDGEIQQNILQRDISDEECFALLGELQHLVDVCERRRFCRLFRETIGVDQKVLPLEIPESLRLEKMSVVSMMFQGVGQSNEHFLVPVRVKILQTQFNRSPRIARRSETRSRVEISDR